VSFCTCSSAGNQVTQNSFAYLYKALSLNRACLYQYRIARCNQILLQISSKRGNRGAIVPFALATAIRKTYCDVTFVLAAIIQTRSDWAQTWLSRRLREHWYRAVIYRGRSASANEKGEVEWRNLLRRRGGARGGCWASKERVNGSTVRQMVRRHRLISRHRRSYVPIRSRRYFIITGGEILCRIIRETPSVITVMRLTSDNFMAFYGLRRFIAARFPRIWNINVL